MPGSQKSGRLNLINSIVSGCLGNLIVWYDWYVFIAFRSYIELAFFPEDDPVARRHKVALFFAIGFLMRPFGSWLFGLIADRKGRKYVIAISALLMAIGSALVVFTPEYSNVGIMAPIMFLIARVLQGLSIGGEYGASTTYFSEIAPPKRRGFYTSFQYLTLIGGLVLAIGMHIILSRFFYTDAEMISGRWRMPFGIGAVFSFIVVIYLQFNMKETAAFEGLLKHKEYSRSSIKELLKWRIAIRTISGISGRGKIMLREISVNPIWLVTGFAAGGNLAFYMATIYLPTLMTPQHFSKELSENIVFFALLIFALIQPIFGWLSDQVGRRPLLIGFGIASVLTTFPIYKLLQATTNPWAAAGLFMAALVIVSGYMSVNGIVKAELFPARIRALGVGLPHAIAAALFGGSAEYFALVSKDGHLERYYFLYAAVVVFLSLLVYLSIKETRTQATLGNE